MATSKQEAKKKLKKEMGINIGEDKGYVWDEDQVRRIKYFPQDTLNKEISFGLLFPKMQQIKDEDGNLTGENKQVFIPRVISKEFGIKSISNWFKEDYNIEFKSIPSYLPRRWKLNDIKEYLDGLKKPVDPKILLDKITSQYENYLSIRNKTWYKIHAIWDIGTYMYMQFSTYPFIELRGIAGTGKTKSMIISSFISFNGSEIMINPSEATLFREKEEIRGTTYFDEAEKLWVFNKATKQYEGDVRTELINASYSKSGKVPRQEKIKNKFVTKWYSPYGAVQLGSINGLYGATEQRAITRITTKSLDKDERGEMEPEDDRDLPIWAEIRDLCYRFSLDNSEKVKEIYSNFPKDIGLKKRDLQLWRPLLSIAKFIDEDVYQEILKFAKELTTRKLDDMIPESSFDFMCLNALKSCIEKIETDGEIISYTKKNELKSVNSKIYVEHIKNAFSDLKGDQESKNDPYLNRNISNHLDKLGFKELRNNDMKASYFEVSPSIFDEIVSPISPKLVILSPSSPSSPYLYIKQEKKCGDSKVIKGDEAKEIHGDKVINGGYGDQNERFFDFSEKLNWDENTSNTSNNANNSNTPNSKNNPNNPNTQEVQEVKND